MEKYFTEKLNNIQKNIDSVTKSIVEYAKDLDIKSIMLSTDKLQKLVLSQEEFTKDAVLNISVDDVIKLINAKVINLNKVTYIYKYDKAVTLAERQALLAISYKFNDVKIKH